MDIMIDIETLGRTPGSVILSIGAICFDNSGCGASFYEAISPASCTDAGLTIEADTVAWWMAQSDDARAAAFDPNAKHINVVLFALKQWFIDCGGDKPWSHGAAFDFPILEEAYRRTLMMPAPWDFRNVRDTRTLYGLSGVKVDRSIGTHHNALDDAVAQAHAAIDAHRKLGIWPEEVK